MDVDESQADWFGGTGVNVLREMGFQAGQRVLDFGCGPGRFAVPLSVIVADGHGEVIALDHAEDSLAELRRRLDCFGRPTSVRKVHVEEGDGFSALPVGGLDAALAFDVLQHIKSWPPFFEAIRFALRPGGLFYVYPAAVPHPGAVDIDRVAAALTAMGFEHHDCHRVLLPHANSMVEDEVNVFAKQ